MNTNDKPAFPHIYYKRDSIGEFAPRYQEAGMSLKDYYKGLAFQSILTGLMLRWQSEGFTDEAAIDESSRLAEYAANSLLNVPEVK